MHGGGELAKLEGAAGKDPDGRVGFWKLDGERKQGVHGAKSAIEKRVEIECEM